MVRLRTTLLCAAAGLLVGCYAIEEIDKGWEKMNKIPSPNQPADAASTETPTQETDEEKKLARQRAQTKRWWQNSQSLSATDLNDDKPVEDQIVRCEIGGGTQFMQRADCLARGGSPAG